MRHRFSLSKPRRRRLIQRMHRRSRSTGWRPTSRMCRQRPRRDSLRSSSGCGRKLPNAGSSSWRGCTRRPMPRARRRSNKPGWQRRRKRATHSSPSSRGFRPKLRSACEGKPPSAGSWSWRGCRRRRRPMPHAKRRSNKRGRRRKQKRTTRSSPSSRGFRLTPRSAATPSRKRLDRRPRPKPRVRSPRS